MDHFGRSTSNKGVNLKKYYRVLIVVFFFLVLIGLTISNHKKSEQLKRAKSTTEYIQKDTNVFEPYENGGKLDNKITDSDGNDITPAPQD